MTLHLHHLTGCAPAPLSHYLKALGVLRVVGEQKDPSVRGWWQDEHFCLLTTLDRAALEKFLLEEYQPTAVVSPWNRGSGFYGKGDPALTDVEASHALRFARFRAGVAAGRAILAAISTADAEVRALKDRTKVAGGMNKTQATAARQLKDDPEFKKDLAAAERKFKRLKAELFPPIERNWRGSHRDWMDAAVVVTDSGRIAWPSMVGTGGADGRLDFTLNFMLRLGQLFDLSSSAGGPRPECQALLSTALWSVPTPALTAGAAIGQFSPGQAGGANSTTAPDGESLINPWDFVLMLEGTVLFGARSTRRMDPSSEARASAPFSVRAQATGHATPGLEGADRGEQWMPLWNRAACWEDVRAMIGEARVQLGRQVANRPIDAARAISRLGIARGITEFTRFGYLVRNGQSNLAVPLGRVAVRARPHARLVDDMAGWLGRLGRIIRDGNAPARLVDAEHRLSDAVFAALTHDHEPSRWQAILAQAAGVEAVLASGTAFAAGPIPPLSPEWLHAADDGSPEWRLACSLGSAAAAYARGGRAVDPIRHHWLSLELGCRRFKQAEGRLVNDPRVVATGRDPLDDLISVASRRILESAAQGQRRLPLVSAPGFDAQIPDLVAFTEGRVDVERVATLGRALMAVSWGRCERKACGGISGEASPDPGFAVVRLASLPWPLADGCDIPADATVLRRLAGGDGPGAVDAALRRLRSARVHPPIQIACVPPETSRIWAAALAFPISHRSAERLARRLTYAPHKETR
jgi:CRISPR-associated protein Csx17